jgi:PIN domain nuclease of toxin-antitoxin system
VSLLLDTHALVWWIGDEAQLSTKQRSALERAEASGEAIFIAAISLWELAKLIERKRIRVTGSPDVLFDELDSNPMLRVLPLTPRIALESTRLGDAFHKDPADQLIVATARVHGLRLMTSDERIRKCGVVSVV